MNKNTALTLASALALALALLTACSEQAGEADHDHASEAAAIERGPHGGRLLHHDDFALELAIFEAGVPPEFRVWLYENDKALSPSSADVQVNLTRLDGTVDTFTFKPENDYLRGSGVVASRILSMSQSRRARKMNPWNGSSVRMKGARQIAAPDCTSDGCRGRDCSARRIEGRNHACRYGASRSNPHVAGTCALPGVIREVRVEPLSVVARGAVLAQVQSNESLQNYPLTAPIAGTIVEHRAQIGEATGEEALFTIIDVSKVWVELDVFQSELGRIDVGQPPRCSISTTSPIAAGRVDRTRAAGSPRQPKRSGACRDRQRDRRTSARTVRHRRESLLAKRPCRSLVEREGLQRFRDFDVVFEKVGDVYEVRMLELGRG